MTDDLQPLVEALQRKCRHQSEQIDELQSELDDVREQLAGLQRLVDPDPGAADYEKLTRQEKVYQVRKKLVETAARTNGKAAMDYEAVMLLFDGHPSAGHCYDLMERAGQLEGFAYDESPDGTKRIRTKIEDVNDETFVHVVNNAQEESAA
jgi:hypothetical protein